MALIKKTIRNKKIRIREKKLETIKQQLKQEAMKNSIKTTKKTTSTKILN